MKLSETTVSLLKNLAAINANIFVKAGNTLTTMAVAKNILAEVTVAETFPNDFGIFNLPEFLGVLSLMSSPDLSFEPKYVQIKGDGSTIKYTYASPDILVYPQRNISMPPADVTFSLSASQLATISKAAAAIGVSDVSFVGDGTKIIAQVSDKKNDSSNVFTLDIGAETKETFSLFFKTSNMKFIADDYTVEISKKNISRFVGKAYKVSYFVAIEECEFS